MREGAPVAVVAPETGICEATLFRWKHQALNNRPQAVLPTDPCRRLRPVANLGNSPNGATTAGTARNACSLSAGTYMLRNVDGVFAGQAKSTQAFAPVNLKAVWAWGFELLSPRRIVRPKIDIAERGELDAGIDRPKLG
jgi:transposase-like protein